MLRQQPTPPYGETTWLQWRMSWSTKLYCWASILLFIFITWGMWRDICLYLMGRLGSTHNLFGFYFSWAFLTTVNWSIVYLDQGYRIAFDDEAIYTRQHGIRWNFKHYPFVRIPFKEIALVRGEWQRMRPGKGLLVPAKYVMPFQFVRVYRQDWDGRELFPLVGGELLDNEFKDLLRLIDSKAPGTIDDEVREYMDGDFRF